MIDTEKNATVEMAFELGKLTRRALHHCSDDAFRVELSTFASHLHELGHEKIARDILAVFVAGFHDEELEKRNGNFAVIE